MTPTHDTAPEVHERFLLGDLSIEEQNRFEHRLLEDPTLFEQVEAAEDDLVDRYARTELEASERRRFEERLLVSERLRHRVTTARSLLRIAHRVDGREDDARSNGSASHRIPTLTLRNGKGQSGHGSSTQWLAWAACIVSLVAAGVLALTSLRLQDRLERVEQAHHGVIERALSAEERAEEMGATLERMQAHEAEVEGLRERLADRNERIASLEERVAETSPTTSPATAQGKAGPDGARAAERTSLFLALATRGAEEPERLELPVPGEAIELQLGLDRIAPTGKLTVTVLRNGVPIWRRVGAAPVRAGLETMVPVTLPAESLLPGAYDLEVTQQTASGVETLGTYGLLVEN